MINRVEYESMDFQPYNCSKIALFAHDNYHGTVTRYTADLSLCLSYLVGVRGCTDGGVVLLHLDVSDLKVII